MPKSRETTRGLSRRNHASRGATSRPRKKISRLKLAVWAVIALAVIGAAVAIFATGDYTLKDLSDSISGLNPALVISLMAILPLFGFSISIVYLVVGARFGAMGGLVVVTGITAFHLLATYWLTRSFLRERLERFIERRGYHLPKVLPGEHTEICLLGTLVPGLPYFVRNYLLALTDAPLRIYFWVCLAVYVLRSYVAILIGDLAGDAEKRQMFIIAGVYAVKLGACAFIVWRLRRHRHPKGAA